MSALVESLATLYLKGHPGEAASVLDDAEPEDIVETLSGLDAEARAVVLRRMNAHLAVTTLIKLERKLAISTLVATETVRVARWLALLEESKREALLFDLPEDVRAHVLEALEYPSGSAGYYMDAGTVSFHSDSTIERVIATIRAQGTRRVADVMVCDDEDHLLGVVPVQELLGADPASQVGSLLNREALFVHAMTSSDEVVAILDQHRLASLPVVDLDKRLLGVIRHDAFVRAAQKAAGDDLGKMVGVGAEERALSPASFTVKSRLPWLMINLVTAFAAASVVGMFDETIARFTALAVLLPVVAGQSGNTGAQALAVTSRGLALREIRTSHWARVTWKEVMAAAVNGVAISAVTSAGVWVWSQNLGLCAVIALSMVISMVLAAVSGAVIPILLSALGRDPATASSIILTTVTDIVGFFSFLGLATVLAEYLG